MKTHAKVLVPGALLLSLFACGGGEANPASTPGPGPAPTGTPDPNPVVPAATCPEGETFRLVANKIIVQVSINDGPNQSWILDTGAPTSAADSILADEVRGKKVKLTVAGVDKEITMPVLDIRDAMRMDVVGVLGQDVFGQVLTVDYPRARFWIEPELREDSLMACDHVQKKPAIVDAKHEDYLYVRGTAEGRAGWFLVDTGASMGAMTKGTFAALDAAHPRPSLSGFYTPAELGTFWARLTNIASLEVGGHSVQQILTRTIDDDLLPGPSSANASEPMLGCLPSGFMRHFMVTTDFKKKKMRIDPGVGDSLREPTTAFPVGIGLEENLTAPFHIATVLPGSPAAAAGIVAGDELTKIDSIPLSSMDAYSRAFRLMDGKEGTAISVTVKHEGVETTYKLTTKDLLTIPAIR